MSEVLSDRTQGQDLRSLPRDPFIPKGRTTASEAKKIISDLLDAGNDGAMAQYQDGGVDFNVVFSRVPGHEDEVMTLEEAECRTDEAIRNAYKALTGQEVTGDPVDFINS